MYYNNLVSQTTLYLFHTFSEEDNGIRNIDVNRTFRQKCQIDSKKHEVLFMRYSNYTKAE